MEIIQSEDLTQEQLSIIATGKCPDCGGRLLYGPRGGAAINVKCDSCGNKFNVAITPIGNMGERI